MSGVGDLARVRACLDAAEAEVPILGAEATAAQHQRNHAVCNRANTARLAEAGFLKLVQTYVDTAVMHEQTASPDGPGLVEAGRRRPRRRPASGARARRAPGTPFPRTSTPVIPTWPVSSARGCATDARGPHRAPNGGGNRKALDAALGQSVTPQVRYWALVTLIDPRVDGATGAYVAGAYALACRSAEAARGARAVIVHWGTNSTQRGVGGLGECGSFPGFGG